MYTVITNFGSTGDFQPYLALACELRLRGHRAVMAFPPHFRSLIEPVGLEFVPIGPELRSIQGDIITAMQVMPDSAEELRAMFSPLVAALPQMFRELSAACCDADVLISGAMQPASRMIHELTGIPFCSVQENHFGGGGSIAFQEATRVLINPFRAEHRLPPLRNPLIQDANSPHLALYAMSRHIFPRPVEWPAHYHMVGYFFVDEGNYQPDEALVEFLSAGDPPVVITFGSMTHDDPDALTELLLNAVEMTGCRAIIQQGWSGLAKRQMPHNVFAADFVLHTWLFSYASCVVHHGGPGTAAAAFRAGVPGIFVPHTFDQPIWAGLAYDLGTVPPIPILELTAERLAEAIITTLSDPRYRQIAMELSRDIRAEQGVKEAASLIEQLVYETGLSAQEEESLKETTGRTDEREEKGSRRRHYQKQQRSRKANHWQQPPPELEKG